MVINSKKRNSLFFDAKIVAHDDAKIEYVNPEYSPEAGQKAIQESIKNSGEAAKKAKEQAKKK